MMSMFKNYTVAAAFVLVFVLGGVFILYKQAVQRVPTESPAQPQGRQGMPSVDSREWMTYYNPKYGFKVDHPSGIRVEFVEDDFIGGDSVQFGESPGGSSIIIKPTTFDTPEQWLASLEPYIQRTTAIDRSITIAGHPGRVIRYYVEEGSPHFSTSVVFIKGGYLFQINGGSYTDDFERERERTWNSFKFEE